MVEEISARELKEKLDNDQTLQLIDVREPDEFAFARIDGSKLIPLGEIVRRMDELDSSREIVIHCKAGGRSAKAIELLQIAGFQGSLKNLRGGITSWSNEVDPRIPKY